MKRMAVFLALCVLSAGCTSVPAPAEPDTPRERRAREEKALCDALALLGEDGRAAVVAYADGRAGDAVRLMGPEVERNRRATPVYRLMIRHWVFCEVLPPWGKPVGGVWSDRVEHDLRGRLEAILSRGRGLDVRASDRELLIEAERRILRSGVGPSNEDYLPMEAIIFVSSKAGDEEGAETVLACLADVARARNAESEVIKELRIIAGRSGARVKTMIWRTFPESVDAQWLLFDARYELKGRIDDDLLRVARTTRDRRLARSCYWAVLVNKFAADEGSKEISALTQEWAERFAQDRRVVEVYVAFRRDPQDVAKQDALSEQLKKNRDWPGNREATIFLGDAKRGGGRRLLIPPPP